MEPCVLVVPDVGDGRPLTWVEMEVPDRPPVGAVLLGYTEDGSALILLLYDT